MVGSTGMKAAKKRPLVLVIEDDLAAITDLGLPGIDGYELAAACSRTIGLLSTGKTP